MSVLNPNQRVQWNDLDIYYGQLAPSQANRTEYYPGKATSKPGDILGKDYLCPQSNAQLEQNGPVEMTRVRIIKTGRNTVCDQTIGAPDAGAPVTTVIVDKTRWENDPESTLTPTETQDVNGEEERTAGYDWPSGAL